MPSRFLILFLALALLAPASMAQKGLIAGSTVAAETQTGDNGLLGLVAANGRIFVSGRNASAGPHYLYEFDCVGTLLGTYQQSFNASFSGSTWGYRDMASDYDPTIAGSGTKIFCGYEGGRLEELDIDPASPTYSLVPVTGTAPLDATPTRTWNFNGAPNFPAGTTIRGLAYDPSGDGGQGSIFTANFGGPLLELGINGPNSQTVLNVFPNPTTGPWSVYGLGITSTSPTEVKMWVNSIPNAGPLGEIVIDRTVTPQTATVTVNSMARQQPSSAQGGLSPIHPSSPCYPAGALGPVVVALDQGTPDSYSSYDAGPTANLLTGVAGGTLTKLQTQTYGAQVINWSMVTVPAGDPLITGSPAVTVVNIGVVGSPPTASTLGGVIPGLVIGNLLSTPPDPGAIVVASDPAFIPVLPFVGFYIPGIPAPLVIDDIQVGTSLVPFTLGPGVALYMQAFYVNALGNLNSTNLSGWDFQTPVSVLVEADGANSFNATTTSGFFKVSNTTGVDIVQVQFDLVPQAAGMEFDTDQTGMADRFDGGNSLLAGTCGGTYRNASDVNTGLDYTGTPVSPCDPAANTGWLGTNVTTTLGGASFQTLTFNFLPGNFNNPGEVFEFDVDTDLGPGFTGGAMAGMVVTIQLAGGGSLSGTLAVDPGNPLRSSAGL